MILQLDLAPADEARKNITSVINHLDRFIQSRENGISHASQGDMEAYLKSMVPYPTEIISMAAFKDRYELEIELGFVKVGVHLKRY